MTMNGIYFLTGVTPGEVVKAYTALMKISESKMAQLLAQFEVTSDQTLGEIAEGIREWLQKVDSPNTNGGFSLIENLENELCITKIDETDTAYTLAEAFFAELNLQKSFTEK